MGFCCGFCPWFTEQSEGSEKFDEDIQEPIHTSALDQATNKQSQVIPFTSESPLNDKVNQLGQAIEQKRTVCFLPNMDKPAHEVSISCPTGSPQEFDKGFQQQVLGAATTIRETMDEKSCRARTRSPYPRGGILIKPGSKSDDSPTQENEGVEDASEDYANADNQTRSMSLTEELLTSMVFIPADISSKDQINSWLSRTVTPPLEETSLHVQRNDVELGIRAEPDFSAPFDTAFDREVCCRLLNHPRHPRMHLAARY
ncbi:hypothetical protein MMC07_007924 [Pseudocyphellaria aurata]|nr:hypothetical protein [Pseudocyphellaria aurata]